MKKSLAISMVILALNMSLGFAAPGDAFPDIPSNHWAFEAVNQLAKDGIFNGDNGKFNSDKTMTRYEMAQIVAEALVKYEKADAQNKAMLDKLKLEFAPELESLVLRIGELEKVDSNFKFRAQSRVRYQVKTLNNDTLNVNNTTKMQQYRTRFWMTGAIDDNWSLTTRLENIQSMDVSGNEGTTSQAQVYLKGKIGQAEMSFGRLPYSPIAGFVVDNHQEGIKIGFGDKKDNVRVTANYGREAASYISTDGTGKYLATSGTSPETILDSTGTAYKSQTRLASIEFAKDLSPVTSAELGLITYKGIDFDSSLGVPTARFTEFLINTKSGKDIHLQANYVKSNAATENVGYLGNIKYKEYDTQKPGSWDVYYTYIHQEKNSQRATTNDGLFQDTTKRYHGYKGPIIGFHIVPFKNAYMDFSYANYSATDDENWKIKDLMKATMYINF